jgi:hypothetical protein
VWVVREVVLNVCPLIPLGHRPAHHDYTLTDACILEWRGYEAYNRCADYTEYRNTVKAPVAKVVKHRNAAWPACTCAPNRHFAQAPVPASEPVYEEAPRG